MPFLTFDGIVGGYVWDYSDGMEFLRGFWPRRRCAPVAEQGEARQERSVEAAAERFNPRPLADYRRTDSRKLYEATSRDRKPLVLRTDFSDQAAWERICAEIREPVGDFYAYVEFVDDVAYRGMTKGQLQRIVPKNYEHSFIILVDRTAISLPEFPLLLVDLYEEPEREFRATPSQIQGIENNLSISNMDFEEFADSVDKDGVFRGFRDN